MGAKITEKVFRAVKQLQAGGASKKEASEYMNITATQAGRIFNAESYEDYQGTVYLAAQKARQAREGKNEKEKQPEKVPEQRPISMMVQATHYVEMEIKKQTEVLERIDRKLGFIVEQLS